MRYRFTLSNDIEGTDILSKLPNGWKNMEFLIKRGTDYHGFFYEQNVSLEFFCKGAGKEFIDSIYESQGIEAIINILIEVVCEQCEPGIEAPDYSIDYSDDYGSISEGNCEWDTFYEGILDLKTWSSGEIFTSVNIIQTGLLQTIRNRLDTKVDLLKLETLDGTPLTPFVKGSEESTLTLHSKAIIKTGKQEIIITDFIYPNVPEGWTEEGSDTDNVSIVFSAPDNAPRVIEHSFSQTCIPEVILFDEVSGHTEDANSLARSNTYPGDDSQIQGEKIYDIINTQETDYIINSKIRFGLKLDIVITSPGLTTDLKDFDYSISPKVYLQTGSTITLIHTVSTISGTHTFAPAVNSVVQNIVPFNEFLFDVSDYTATLNDGDPVRLYVKFDTVWTIERPSLIEESFEMDINFSCFMKSQYSDVDTSYFQIVEESLTPATTAVVFGVFEAGARIAQIISNRTDAFRSNYYGRQNSEPYAYDIDGCGSKRVISNGLMIRGFPTTGDNSRTIHMSMNDYFQGLNPIDNLGLGVEKIGEEYFVVVNPKSYFYDSSAVLLTLSNIPDLQRSVAPDYYYGRVNIGYEKWTTEFTNGLDEPNSKRQYDTQNKAIPNELTVISTLTAAGYRIEDARRMRYSDSVTTDSEYDEELFIICTDDGLTTAEKDENFSQVNNVISPETSYNLRLSPARNYLRWNNVVNAGLTKYPGREVRFTAGEGNYKMTSQLNDDIQCPGSWNNELLSEGSDIQWDDPNNTDKEPLWIPEIFQFKFPLSYVQYKALAANPKGVIRISSSEDGYIKAYILEMTYRPSQGGETDFKLLRAFE